MTAADSSIRSEEDTNAGTASGGAVAPEAMPPQASDVVDHAMRGLFGRDSVYMVLWVLQLIGAAAVTPVLTRAVDIEEFGGVATSNAVMQVLFVIAGCGLQVAIQRWFAERGGTSAAKGLLSLAIVLAVGATAVAAVTGPSWSGLLGFSHFGGGVQLAVYWAGASAVTASCLGLLRSQDRLAAFATVSLLQSVVAEVASLVLVLAIRATAEMFVLGQLLAQLLAMGLALVLTRPRMLGRGDLGLVRSGLVFALPLVPAMLGGLVLNAADRLLVQSAMGSEAVARYQVAYNVGTLPLLVLAALDSTWLPRIFAVEDPVHRDAVLDASRDALYRLLAPVLVGLALGAPLILRLWAPPDFRTDELLLLTTVVVISAVPYAGGLSARRKMLAVASTGRVAGATLIAAGANVVLNLRWIPEFGLMGAALATLIAYALQHVLLLSWNPRVLAHIRVLGAGVLHTVAGTALAFATVLLPVDVGGIALRLVLGLVCLGWFGWALRAIAAPNRGTDPGALRTGAAGKASADGPTGPSNHKFG